VLGHFTTISRDTYTSVLDDLKHVAVNSNASTAVA